MGREQTFGVNVRKGWKADVRGSAWSRVSGAALNAEVTCEDCHSGKEQTYSDLQYNVEPKEEGFGSPRRHTAPLVMNDAVAGLIAHSEKDCDGQEC